MSDHGWNDVDEIAMYLKTIMWTALVSIALVVVLAIYEPDATDKSRQSQSSISRVQNQPTANWRDSAFMKCEE